MTEMGVGHNLIMKSSELFIFQVKTKNENETNRKGNNIRTHSVVNIREI